MPTCSRKWSWHHHQSATVVLKTRWPNIYCRDAHFCRQQEQMCGQRQSSYTPNSTAARRNWRRQPQSSCRLDSVLQRSRRRRTLNDTQWVIWMLNNIRAGQHFGNAQDNVYNTVPSTPFHLVQCRLLAQEMHVQWIAQLIHNCLQWVFLILCGREYYCIFADGIHHLSRPTKVFRWFRRCWTTLAQKVRNFDTPKMRVPWEVAHSELLRYFFSVSQRTMLGREGRPV